MKPAIFSRLQNFSGSYMSEEEEKIFFEILKELEEYFNTKEEKEILKEGELPPGFEYV